MTKTVLAAAVLVASAIGCGGSGPNLVPVTGEVTLDGKPFEGAVVTFLPDPSNTEGQPGEDITGPSGNYKARTGGRSGLVPGRYKVTITKTTLDPAKVPEAFKDDPYMAQLSVEGPPEMIKKNKKSASERIEEQFDRDVPPGGGVIDFAVKAKTARKGS